MAKKKKKNLRKILSGFKFYEKALDTGKIISVKDGVARVNGLFGVLSGEMVHLGIEKIQGMVLSLEHNTVSVVIFGNDTLLPICNKLDQRSNLTYANSLKLSGLIFNRTFSTERKFDPDKFFFDYLKQYEEIVCEFVNTLNIPIDYKNELNKSMVGVVIDSRLSLSSLKSLFNYIKKQPFEFVNGNVFDLIKT